MTRTNLMVALCIFVVVLSVLALILSPTGIVVNHALKAEYATLQYQNAKKEAELEILRENLQAEIADKEGRMPSKDEIIYRFSDEIPQNKVEREPEPMTQVGFKGISMSYLMLIAASCSLLYLCVCVVLAHVRKRRNHSEHRDYREEDW